MKLNDYLKKKGYSITESENMISYIRDWDSWYKNDIPSFQNYRIYNGENVINCRRYGLGLAKKLCEDNANLLMNERTIFRVGKDTQNKIFNEILNQNDFYVLANSGIEKTFALGTGAFVISLNDINYNEKTEEYSFEDSYIQIEFASADKIIPLTYKNQKVIECAFVTEKNIKGKNLVYLAIHKLNDLKKYEIENCLFEKTKSGNLIDISDQIEKEFRVFDTKSNIPWFSILRPGIENPISDVYGLSIYANSIDILKGTDIIYDSLINEFVLGRKRIFVATELLKPDLVSGNVKFTFDEKDIIFHQLPIPDTGEQMIKESDLTLRIDNHEQGLQLVLNLLSNNCGMGTDIYKFSKNKVSTATEVISNNSDLFRSLHKHEIRIENCLYDLFKAICYVGREFLGIKLSEKDDISISFDDSIFEDKKEIKSTAILELNNGLISPIQYYMKVYDMTEDQAKIYYKEVQEGLSSEEKEQEVDEE